MEFQNRQAIYIQIADYVCENILLRKWLDGDKVPSIRDLAVDIQVNPNTVMRTYNYLQEKGIIENQRGVGYHVAREARQKTVGLKKELFIKEELPVVFKTMDLLGISFQEIEEIYRENRK